MRGLNVCKGLLEGQICLAGTQRREKRLFPKFKISEREILDRSKRLNVMQPRKKPLDSRPMDDHDDGYELRERRGGARPGTGPKPEGYIKSSALQQLDEAKARKETALATKHEIDLKVAQGELVPRTAFRAAAASLMSAMAQSIRAIPETLERRHGLSTEQTMALEEGLDDALDAMRKKLAELVADPPTVQED